MKSNSFPPARIFGSFLFLMALFTVKAIPTHLSLIPSGTHLVLFNSEVRITCVVNQSEGVSIIWVINDDFYYPSNALPNGYDRFFSNATASQLRILSFTTEYHNSEISCLTVIDGDGIYSPTLLIMGTDTLPTVTTTTTTTTTTEVNAPTTIKPTPSPTSEPVDATPTDPTITPSPSPTSSGRSISVSLCVVTIGALLSTILTLKTFS